MKLFLLLCFVTTNVFAQSIEPISSSAEAPKNASQSDLPTFSLKNLQSKFRINYFSETLGPSIKKWNDNEVDDDGSIKREPVTMYHSFNVRHLTFGNFNLFMSPRFATAIGDRNDLRDTQDDHVVMMDDWQFGFMYTFIRRPTFNYSQALTHRAPFSTKSRNEDLDSQVEWNHFINYSITPALRLLSWNNYRYYAYEKESTWERYRINWRNILNYSFNDKWNMQLAYEFDIQHSNPKDEANRKNRDFNFMKRYHSYTSLAVGYSPIANWTFMPFIRTVDERNIRNETTILGLWILGRVI